MVRSIVEALAEYAKVQPDKLFLADGKVELTYLDAWKCVYGYAVHLRELGIRRGDHVVVRNSQNAQLVISQLAIQLVGAVFVPIEKNAADDRIAEIIGAVEAKLYLAAKQGEFSCKWETIKDVLSYKMDDAAEMRISESDDENGDSFRFPEPEETAEVLFTTGTTGKSKGIELTYESVIAVSENVIGSVEMKKDSVELIPVPLSHSHGLRRYYSNILNGGSVVIIDGVIFTKKFFGAIEKYHVTAIDLVPAALAALFKLSGDKLPHRSRTTTRSICESFFRTHASIIFTEQQSPDAPVSWISMQCRIRKTASENRPAMQNLSFLMSRAMQSMRPKRRRAFSPAAEP